jgi:large subunit ribosomal protein L7/L12
MAEEKQTAQVADEKEEKKEETQEKKEETQTEETAESKAEESSEEKEVEVPEKFKKLVEEIEQMSVLDLSELVKILEDKFGVSAAAPMAVAAVPGAGGEEAGGEEKSEFNVELTGAGDNKISVIKVVREATGLGLKDAKDLVDGAPKVIKENMPKEEAEELKSKIEEAGGTVDLK